jgi:small GTP-binding protein
MLGSFGVGKTSLVRRFVYNKFEEKYLSTIGVHISHKTIEIKKPDSNSTYQLKLILWDIAHIEKFNAVIKNYFRGANGAIIVYDFSRPQTFENTKSFLEPFLEMNPASKIVFVGNKVDLVDEPDRLKNQLLPNIQPYKSPLVLTSAKTGDNVESLFHKLGTMLI